MNRVQLWLARAEEHVRAVEEAKWNPNARPDLRLAFLRGRYSELTRRIMALEEEKWRVSTELEQLENSGAPGRSNV